MRRSTCIVKLTPKEQSKLGKLLHKGRASARVINRARILLHSHHGKNNKYIAQALSVSITAIIILKRRFQSERLSSLYDKPRPWPSGENIWKDRGPNGRPGLPGTTGWARAVDHAHAC